MKQKRWTWREIGLPGPVYVRKNGKQTEPFRLYRVWEEMKMRTSQMPSWKKFRCAKYYRGVTMCEEWKYFPNFFRWAIENGYRDDFLLWAGQQNGVPEYAAEAGNVIFNWIMLAALLIVFVIVSIVALEFIDRDKR